MSETGEYEFKKKAIFDGMSKRGREHVLRIGYENWNPFEEPKDPRERIFGATSLRAGAIIEEFFKSPGTSEESVAVHKELFELCRGLLQGEPQAKAIFEFCNWYRKKMDSLSPHP